MRRAISFKDAARIHAASGCFLHLMRKLKQMAPEGLYPDMEKSLITQFMSQFLDGDLLNLLESQVPGDADIQSVKAFRPGFRNIQKQFSNGLEDLCA